MDDILLELYESGNNSRGGPDNPRVIRRLSDERLHWWLSKVAEGDSKIALERDLRRRDAWAAPAGRAYRLSCVAVVISFIALIVSAMKT